MVCGKTYLVKRFGADKRKRHYFRISAGTHENAGFLIEFLSFRKTSGSDFRTEILCGYLVIAVYSRRFFGKIIFGFDVASERRNRNRVAIDRHAERREHTLHFRIAHINVNIMIYPVNVKFYFFQRLIGIVNIYVVFGYFARAEHLNEFAGSVKRFNGHLRVKSLFEQCGSVRSHAKPLCALSNSRSVKVCRFEHYHFGCIFYFAVFAAHDPGNGNGSFRVRNNEHIGSKGSFLSVKRNGLFAFFCSSDVYLSAFKARIIKSVHRLTVFKHNIVCYVNDVVYGTDAAGTKSLNHPFRRRSYLDVGHDSCAVTRAEFGVFHRNSQIIVHINAFSFYGRGLDDIRLVKRNGGFSCNASY